MTLKSKADASQQTDNIDQNPNARETEQKTDRSEVPSSGGHRKSTCPEVLLNDTDISSFMRNCKNKLSVAVNRLWTCVNNALIYTMILFYRMVLAFW